MVAKVLGNTGAPIKAREMIYNAVVQTVIIYVVGSLVFMNSMTMVL